MPPPPRNTRETRPGPAGEAVRILGAGLSVSGVAAVLTDRDGGILWANEAMADLAGARLPEDLAGSRMERFVSPTDDDGIVALGRRKERFFRVVAAPLDALRSPAVLHLLVECTREVVRERDRRRLARAADDSMDAIVSLDTDGRIRYWNRGAERMFGYTAADVMDQPYELLVPEDLEREGELERIDEILNQQGVLKNFETVRLARGGRPVEVDITVTRLQDERGEVLGRSVVYRDISLRRRLQAELKENFENLRAVKEELSAKVDQLREVNRKLRRNQERLLELEKLSAIGEMAAKVAHEIRTPLVTIGGFANTVWKTTAPGAPERRYLEIIREEVRRLERIVSEILDYVRPAAVESEPCDVNEMIERVLTTHQDEVTSGGIELERRLSAELPPVQANRYQIHQVLTNLLVNAMQALAGVPPDRRRLIVTSEAGENHVRISIADTGPGIPERHRQRIFRPFFTTKTGGSGLGLAISAQIVAQNQGTLTFDSDEGAGTTFHLRLPVRREVPGDEDDPRGG